jgi:hypothetical protein
MAITGCGGNLHQEGALHETALAETRAFLDEAETKIKRAARDLKNKMQ